MFRALLRSRVQGILASLTRSGKKGKRRSGAGLVGYGLLMLYAGACFLFLFFLMASQLCGPLLSAGLGWLYFALMGVMALALGVIGSVFTTQTQLFEARDNEMLLAMPVPPSYILGSRMLALYGQSFFCSALVLLPTVAAYVPETTLSGVQIVLLVLILFLLPMLSLALSCVLGWLVALISSRMRNKSLITVLLSLAFLGAYVYFYSRMNYYLQLLVANGESVGAAVRRVLFPLYQMGLAAMGSPVAFVWFLLCAVVPFGAVYAVLSASFLKIATTRRGAAKLRYRERALKVSTPQQALLRRELRHLWSSPMYLLNGAFGSVFLLIGAVAAAVKGNALMELLAPVPGLQSWMPVIACAAVCLVAAANIITAPSVSLEGKTIWLVQTMPVAGWWVLKAKLQMHMLVTAIPALLCSAVLAVILRADLLMTLMLLVAPVVFSFLCAVLGLVVNLLMPRLDWVNEAYAVKQSGSSILTIFADWGIVLAFGGLFFLVGDLVSHGVYVLLCTFVMAAACWLMCRWLRRRGAEIFAHLQ